MFRPAEKALLALTAHHWCIPILQSLEKLTDIGNFFSVIVSPPIINGNRRRIWNKWNKHRHAPLSLSRVPKQHSQMHTKARHNVSIRENILLLWKALCTDGAAAVSWILKDVWRDIVSLIDGSESTCLRTRLRITKDSGRELSTYRLRFMAILWRVCVIVRSLV